MSAYTNQLKRALKLGWSHADDDSMLAAVCGSLALRNALRPDAVYEWAVAQGYGYHALLTHASRRAVPDWPLVEAVLNGEPMDAGR